MAVYKNKASQKVACFAYDPTDGSAVTGDAANITAQISKDGAATAATNDTNPAELDPTDAPGIYLFDLTQAETNADLVVIAPVSGTADVLIEPLIIYTEPEQRSVDVVAVSGSSTAADNVEVVFSTDFASNYNTTADRWKSDLTHVSGTGVTAGLVDCNVVSVANDALTAAALAADAGTEIATAVWASGTRTLSALDEDTTTLDLDATIRAAVGMASANLDTQLSAIAGFIDTEIASILSAVDTEVAAIKAKTDSLTFSVAGFLDANVQYVNSVEVTGTGTLGDEWGPA